RCAQSSLWLACLLNAVWITARGAEDPLHALPSPDIAVTQAGVPVTLEPTMSCPKDCRCNLDCTVDCGGVNLKEFPSNVSEGTLHLSLQNNALETIPIDGLSKLHNLETLNLQNNRLTSSGLPDDAFNSLDNLQYLYLANNKLTVAPKFLPKSLVSADVAANYLTRIYPLTFGQKPKLRSIYLHNNKLTDAGLPEHMFNGSDGVGVLIMSSNFVKYVPKNLPAELVRLHLKNNRLEKIPRGAFDHLFQLRELHLQNNHITNDGMDNETFCKLSSLEYLDLASNRLSRVPEGLPRGLVLLHLERNAIGAVAVGTLQPVRGLEYLLLHHNKLRAADIHREAFRGLKRLHTCHLHSNLLEWVPAGLPRRVRSLMLLHNRITTISRNDFALTYLLSELNLSYNRLSVAGLHPEAFRKLRRLDSLDLSGNALLSAPRGLPRNLRLLRLRENGMVSVPRVALAGMSHLRELDLSGNRLGPTAIHPAAWQELPALKLLHLSGNQLSSIPPDLPESLEYIYLQNNQISLIPDDAFQSTPNIKGIFLRGNRLVTTAIKEIAFENLKYLQVLDMRSYSDSQDEDKTESGSETDRNTALPPPAGEGA
uniref:Podocan n=1 Tax=Callorhinchus milii TaxID=7868 RepID=A0A4W3K7M3_CALMI